MRRRLLRFAAFLLGLAVLLVGGLAVLVVSRPFPEALLAREPFESVRVRDRHGRVLREALSDAQGRATWVEPGEGLVNWVPEAFIAIEDHRFRAHRGVDLRGIARAARDNLAAGHIVAGGSTITQQLVGLLLPGPRTFGHKFREAVWALRLERAHSKDTILSQYINRAPYGHGAFGIEAAARLYLGKPASALTLAESALLAGIPRAPSINNPFTNELRALARMRQVLDRMRTLGRIDETTWRQAIEEPIRFATRARQFAAPHFTSWVLAQRPGPGDVVTTLDARLQSEIEDAIAAILPSLADKHVGQAAVLVIDNARGDILAWVGSRDFFDPSEGQVDMVVGERQPGSTLKPFLYGLALEAGETAASRLPDFPMFFDTLTGDYRPQNYDRRYHGWVHLREALASSYNVPAVFLANRIGVGTLHERLRRLGFESLRQSPGHYGLGLALGNGEVRLLELANAYRTLANDGRSGPLRWRADAPLPARERVMPAAVAQLLTDILSDPIARSPSFGRHNALELPFPAAAKTGTSTDFTDNWTVGYTPAVTVATWVGNFDGQPMEGVSGITGAGRLWHRVMRLAAAHRPAGAFSRDALVESMLCADPPDARGPCEHFMNERFVPGTESRATSRPMSAESGAVAVASRLRVAYPGDADVFALSPDVPDAFARVGFRAERTDRLPLGADDAALIWEVDGVAARTSVTGPWFWPASAGTHRVRVWPETDPSRVSRLVEFEVIPAPASVADAPPHRRLDPPGESRHHEPARSSAVE